MNKDIESRLTKYLDYLESAATSGVDAVSTATPAVCQEILVWNAVFPFLFVAPVLAIAVFMQKSRNRFEKELIPQGGGTCYHIVTDGDRAVYSNFSNFFWLAFAASMLIAVVFASRSYLTPHLVIIEAVKSVIRN